MIYIVDLLVYISHPNLYNIPQNIKNMHYLMRTRMSYNIDQLLTPLRTVHLLIHTQDSILYIFHYFYRSLCIMDSHSHIFLYEHSHNISMRMLGKLMANPFCIIYNLDLLYIPNNCLCFYSSYSLDNNSNMLHLSHSMFYKVDLLVYIVLPAERSSIRCNIKSMLNLWITYNMDHFAMLLRIFHYLLNILYNILYNHHVNCNLYKGDVLVHKNLMNPYNNGLNISCTNPEE